MKIDDPTIPDVLKKLADALKTELNYRRLDIPPALGSGYCTGFIFNENIRMLISNYELHNDIVIKNTAINATKKMLFFKFQHVFPKTEAPDITTNLTELPSVLIATSRINTDEVISIHTNTSTINIEVDANYLAGLFGPSNNSAVLQSLLQNTQPLFSSK